MSAEVKAMEMKKPERSGVSGQVLSAKRFREWIGTLKGEIQKITWTNREELLVYTKMVVGTTFVFGMSIYVLDLVIQGALAGLNALLSFIGG